jgi:nitroreductase
MFYSIYQYYVNNENIQQTSFFKPFTVASMLILLTAVNEGIGVCFVGAFDDIKVSKILEIPKQVRPIGILCVGYPDEEPERIERISLSKLVYYNKYGNTSG